MPRTLGIFSLVPSYLATSGATIKTEQHNPPLEDIAQALTDSLPRDGSAPMTGALAMGSNKITGLATGTNAGDAVRFDQISGLAPKLVPAGTIIFTAQSTAPSGYLKANAPTVSRTTYADLFAAIGTTYGAGDGSTTFVAGPDMRGEFPRGWDDGRGVDIGRIFGSNQDAAFVNHSHTGVTGSAGAHTHTNYVHVGSGPIGGSALMVSNASVVENPTTRIATNSAGDHTHAITTAGATVGGGTETRPRNIALLACIKY